SGTTVIVVSPVRMMILQPFSLATSAYRLRSFLRIVAGLVIPSSPLMGWLRGWPLSLLVAHAYQGPCIRLRCNDQAPPVRPALVWSWLVRPPSPQLLHRSNEINDRVKINARFRSIIEDHKQRIAFA